MFGEKKDAQGVLFLLVHDHVVLANLEVSVTVAEVEPVALTIAPNLAFGALLGLHPPAVAVLLVTVLPDIPETVLVDIALMVVATDA